jgi:radical SAM protein with 4Fe4S-binding SPASM domain
MPAERLHRFEEEGRRYAIDPETCFCFECDDISWDVLEHYPDASLTRIVHLLGERHDPKELLEVYGELEWLRASKSILPRRGVKEYYETFEIPRGLRRVSVAPDYDQDAASEPETGRKRGWFGGQTPRVFSNTAASTGRDAAHLLLSRSGAQQELQFEVIQRGGLRHPEPVAALCRHALRLAGLAGKKLTAAVRLTDLRLAQIPEPLKGHAVSLLVAFAEPDAVDATLRAMAHDGPDTLARLAKAAQSGGDGAVVTAIVEPGHPEYAGAVQALLQAGFTAAALDLDGAYIAHPDLAPADMLPALSETARFYAQALLAGRMFRLDPIASLFYRIHEGRPEARSDPAGTNELAVDADGRIYPSRRLLGMDAFAAGSLADGQVDEDALKRFDDVGSITTAPCRSCWARTLCGGGSVAVHHALSGSFRTPHEPWCDAQRAWMASAVSAFNILSAEGVNFSRIYQGMTGRGKKLSLSLFSMARAALNLTVTMRPVEEADAEMLAKWENWNEASYFTLHPNSVLSVTRYEREMAALHPRGLEQEMIVTRKDGTPVGLLRLSPDMAPKTAQVAVFLHDPALYASDEMRRGFRTLLQEGGKLQDITRIVTRADRRDRPLAEFLEALGFKEAGIEREALFLSNARHDVTVYAQGDAEKI